MIVKIYLEKDEYIFSFFLYLNSLQHKTIVEVLVRIGSCAIFFFFVMGSIIILEQKEFSITM